MKKIFLFTIGLLITLIGFSQSKVKVYGSFNYYIAMIIPFGEKFILEEYSKIKFYNLESTDTLELINDSVFLKYIR